MIKKISVIGTGKVAYHFAKEIFNNTHLKLIRIVGRSKNLNPLFNKFKNLYSNDFSLIPIEAVLNPSSHKFIYFVADVSNPGYHLFSKTNAEHNQKKRQYTKWLKERNIRR